MEVLVCITNNLRYDTRVKRHVSAIAEVADKVHVLAQANPDEHFHLILPNVSHTFVHIEREQSLNLPLLLNLAAKLDVKEEILAVAPMLFSSRPYHKEELGRLLQMQEDLFSSDRWAEVRAGIPQEATDAQQMGSWIWLLETFLRWAQAAVQIPADVIYCNDVETLLCGVAHKKRYGSRLIYDAHDVFYDLGPQQLCRTHRYFLAMLENEGIRYADAVISIGRTALQLIKTIHSYIGPMYFIPNCTVENGESSHGFSAKTSASPLRFYYHGIAHPLRGLEKVIQALRFVDNAVLNLRCLPTPYLDVLRQAAKQAGVADRVFFLDAVLAQEIPLATAKSADVGIAFWDNQEYERMSLGLKISLNNKFIEYLKAGVPVLTMKGTEQGDVVEQYSCGLVGRCSIEDLTEKMKWFCAHSEQYIQMSENALRASKELFDWLNYKELLQNIVSGKSGLADPYNANPEPKYLLYEKRIWQRLYYQYFYQNRRFQEEFKHLEDFAFSARDVENSNKLSAELAGQLTGLQAEYRMLRQQNMWLQQKYVGLLYSKSWRITKPVRWLARRLSRHI